MHFVYESAHNSFLVNLLILKRQSALKAIPYKAFVCNVDFYNFDLSPYIQVRQLRGLKKLEQLSLMNNPCITYQQITHHNSSYRAYVLSWTCSLEVLDGQHVTLVDRCV